MPKKKSFILYADYIKHIERLSDDEAGKLFKAIFCYVNNGRLPDLDGMSAMAFSFISNQLDNDLQKYEETCKKRSENIKKRWDKVNSAKKATGDLCDTNDTNEYKSIFCNTNDTDNDSVNDNENVNDIDNDSDSVSVLHSNMRPMGEHHTIHLTQKQYNDLCEKYSQAVVERYIDKIDHYLYSNGKAPYKNHYDTVIKWIEEDGAKAQPSKQPSFDLGLIMDHARKNKPEV
jgi:hypothetical protein|nr:MAG TPA: hypothetical protein [Caudoviricetes sp.]